MMSNNCCGNMCKNDSKAMYSVDYDSLIEKLTHTRDEIDNMINTLESRKNMDKTINDILSSDYDDELDIPLPKKESNNIPTIDGELEELLRDIQDKDIHEIVGKDYSTKNKYYTKRFANPFYRWKITYPYDIWW